MQNIVFPSPNGVSLSSGEKMVISITDSQGQKRLKSFENKNKIIFWHFPFLRGLQYFCCGIFEFFKILVLSDDLSFQSGATKDKNEFHIKKLITLAIFVIFGAIFAEILLGFVPNVLSYLIVDYRGSTAFRNLVCSALKVVVFYAIMLSLRCFGSVVDMFRFNRAYDLQAAAKNTSRKRQNQKFDAIFLWLNGELVVSNFCNYLIFVYLCDVIVITLIGADFGIVFNFVFHLSVLIISSMACYEILLAVENVSLLSPLRWITFCLVSEKPSRTHLETVSIAISEMNMLQKGRQFMEDVNKKSFAVVMAEVKNRLAAKGITDKSDAEWIVATVLGKNRAEIKLVPNVTEKQYQDIIKATERRAAGESVDNIFGFTEFYGLRFDVNKKVLTPRMETELLVEQVLKAQKNFKNCTILDLGTGSGAIAVSVAKNCDAKVTAVDVSKPALLVAEQNAKKNGVNVEFLHSNLFEGLKRKRKFDIIVSNPPYIPTAEIEHLDKNVKECDPILALDGGDDGLDFYREIISQAGKRLGANGMILFEVGRGQAASVRKILRENGFEDIKTTKDYNKIERIVSGRIR
jgi:release factor glutamine methyltransferase